ncbi:MAG: response regulator [Acidobacteriales bacterium]|nr:response regulator [Terriglobales bacterium]
MRPKKTILCVDDSEHSNSVRKFMLETRGYRVLIAHNGKEAIDLFRDNTIDLVLSDLMMPDMNGAELVRKLKDFAPETPAILFSGKIRTYEEGTHADVFLPKGTAAPNELLERIRLLLVRKRGPKKGVRRDEQVPVAKTA